MAKKVSCEELRNQLLAANAAYRSGESIMSDVEYDALVEKLRKLDPSDKSCLFLCTVLKRLRKLSRCASG